MHIVSIDTSTAFASLALGTEDKILAEALLPADRCLSARLIPEIEHLAAAAGLAINQIDLFAATIGPGSFTGVRAGVATAQGLALATGKPCVGLSTLAMLAMNICLASRPVCPLLDARKQEVYGALYDCSNSLPAPLIDDCVLPPDAMIDAIQAFTEQQVIFVGEGAVRYGDLITARMGDRAVMAPFSHHSVRAANGILLALDAYGRGQTVAPAKLLPVYLRASEAEIARKKR